MSTAKKTAKGKSKPKSTKPATKRLGHKEGSRKGKVHHLFDEQGAEAAWVLGRKLQLKEGTLRSWFAAWKRSQNKGEVKTNAAVMPATTPETVAA